MAEGREGKGGGKGREWQREGRGMAEGKEKKGREESNSFYKANITLMPKLDKDITKKIYYSLTPLMNIDAKSSMRY